MKINGTPTSTKFRHRWHRCWLRTLRSCDVFLPMFALSSTILGRILESPRTPMSSKLKQLKHPTPKVTHQVTRQVTWPRKMPTIISNLNISQYPIPPKLNLCIKSLVEKGLYFPEGGWDWWRGPFLPPRSETATSIHNGSQINLDQVQTPRPLQQFWNKLPSTRCRNLPQYDKVNYILGMSAHFFACLNRIGFMTGFMTHFTINSTLPKNDPICWLSVLRH